TSTIPEPVGSPATEPRITGVKRRPMSSAPQMSRHAQTPGSTGDVLSRLPEPQQRLVALLARAVGDLGGELYLVGGGVRDILLGEQGPADLDFATSLRPDQVRVVGETLPNVRVYDIGEKFGTIGFVIQDPELVPATDDDHSLRPDPDIVEITTYRSEAYEPGSRHPAVMFRYSIEADLGRGDFPVHALALNVSTGLSRHRCTG